LFRLWMSFLNKKCAIKWNVLYNEITKSKIPPDHNPWVRDWPRVPQQDPCGGGILGICNRDKVSISDLTKMETVVLVKKKSSD